MVSVVIKPSTNKAKKYMAIFTKDGKKIKTTHFGAAGMNDYTITGDKERRRLYLERHKNNESWGDYMSAGSLSRFILWGDSKSIQANIKTFKNKFSLS